MSESEPERLVRWICSGALRPGYLTLAAEALGESIHEAVVPGLLKLLEHETPMVREGAIFGLQKHPRKEAIGRLRELSQSDPSKGVRVAAQNALEDLSEMIG
jgi:HEAT repeat protein